MQDKATLNGRRTRAEIIEQEIWARAQKNAVTDWEREYLVPMLLAVGYGLLVHLDSARNWPALVATVLSLAGELELSVGAGASA